jgi:hypothetical protein
MYETLNGVVEVKKNASKKAEKKTPSYSTSMLGNSETT